MSVPPARVGREHPHLRDRDKETKRLRERERQKQKERQRQRDKKRGKKPCEQLLSARMALHTLTLGTASSRTCQARPVGSTWMLLDGLPTVKGAIARSVVQHVNGSFIHIL